LLPAGRGRIQFGPVRRACLLVPLAVSCASGAPPAARASTPGEEPPDVVYRVDLRAPDHVVVDLSAGAEAAREGLRVPLEWEGRGDMDKAIHVVDVTDAAGRPLAHSIERWTLRAPGATGGLRVHYEVGTRGGLVAETEGYPIRSLSYFLSTGHPLFLVPEVWVESGAGRYQVEVALPDGWRLYTTAGADRVLRRNGMPALRDLVMAAGDFSQTGRSAWDQAPALVMRGPWRWQQEDLLRPARAVFAEVGRLFSGRPGDRYTVFLLPWPSAQVRVGHSLHEALLVAAGQDFDPAEPDAVSFLASQMVRGFVGEGGVLRHRGDSVFDTLWFRDGIPAYYGVLLPARAGQIPRERALVRLQEAIVNDYRRHAIRDLRVYDLGRWYNWDERVVRSTAEKGALVAFMLDVRLRSREKSLDGWLRDLERRLDGGKRRYTAADLIAAASAYAGEDLGAFFSARVLGIEPLPVEAWLRDAGFTVGSQREEFPDFGMGMRVEEGVLRLADVSQTGAAHRAGLREGDVVQDYFLPEGRYDLEAWVRVDRAGGASTIRFVPDRGLRDVIRLSADSPAAKAILEQLLSSPR
jgi:predicted metalloprotease with PDZ domain